LFAFYFHFPTAHTTVRAVLVYGGSLISYSDRFVVTREENVTGFSQMLVSNRTVKDKTAGSVPIAFPGIPHSYALYLLIPNLMRLVTLVLIRFRCFQITMRKRRRYHPSVTFKSFRISVSLKYCIRPLTYCLSFPSCAHSPSFVSGCRLLDSGFHLFHTLGVNPQLPSPLYR
jgi:hypothetical protein